MNHHANHLLLQTHHARRVLVKDLRDDLYFHEVVPRPEAATLVVASVQRAVADVLGLCAVESPLSLRESNVSFDGQAAVHQRVAPFLLVLSFLLCGCEPVEPTSEEAPAPEAKQPAESETEQPAEPEGTELAPPEPTQPAEPEGEKPAAPEAEEPTEPTAEEKPAKPGTEQPAEPAEKQAESETESPAEPETQEPTEPDSN